VFDFKSLYPTIIRTFNIDPLSYIPDRFSEAKSDGAIEAPNGARFKQEKAILPELLERFFNSREEAKKSHDAFASYVYKIIMNSFYGVLGASGCRFAGSALAGAITSFGHRFLHWCEQQFLTLGYPVLYGDTDSLFVLSKFDQNSSPEEIDKCGQGLCDTINERLSVHIRETFGVVSHLELEFEKTYSRFFLPRIRGAGGSASRNGSAVPRGRAKGYAGLILPSSGGAGAGIGPHDVEIKGMEAVRRDWTELAKAFQLRMLVLVFERRSRDEISDFVKETIKDVYDGKHDRDLVYIKALRKHVSAYTRSLPPHVKAARLLDPEDQHGLIHYVQTVEGPQPVSRLTGRIDYDHYVAKQLKPIASTFDGVMDIDLAGIFDNQKQLELF